jgi:hypothetical protein
MRLSLNDERPRQDLVAVSNISNPQTGEITATEFAVDCQLEQGEVAYRMSVPKVIRIAKTSLGLSGGFFPTGVPLCHASRVCSVFMTPPRG